MFITEINVYQVDENSVTIVSSDIVEPRDGVLTESRRLMSVCVPGIPFGALEYAEVSDWDCESYACDRCGRLTDNYWDASIAAALGNDTVLAFVGTDTVCQMCVLLSLSEAFAA
jgi:hypothetical protein